MIEKRQAGNQLLSSKEQQMVAGAGCYHDLWVSCRTNNRRFRDGGKMSSCCFTDMCYMLLLLEVNWRNRHSFGLEQGRCVRCGFLLVEALHLLMLYRNITQPNMREAQFQDLWLLDESSSLIISTFFRVSIFLIVYNINTMKI